MYRKIAPLLIAVAAIPAVTAAPASADVTVPILPHQHFEGFVNGKTDNVVIATQNCHLSPLGVFVANPVPGQHVKVVLDPDSDGFTGDNTHTINVQFPSPPPVVNPPVVLHDYGVSAPIPVSLTVPCTGPGQVRFAPVPNGATEIVGVIFKQLPPPPA